MSESAGARRVDVSGVVKSFSETPVLVDVELSIDPGENMALLGPSGCGKTTLLRLIAGLERPDAGTIAIGGRLMAGPDAWVPPEKRNVGMVFQDWALFPHLSVGRNVSYGLPRAERNGPRVKEALDMVGMADYLDRMPDTLSGGQQQRVALARAIAPRPTVLLLDEPFSNLDTALRVDVRTEVHRLLNELEITSVFVTHDQEEAFVLGDRVAIMRSGHIDQIGTPRQVYRTPENRWIAGFVGDVNLVRGVADGRTATTDLGIIPLSTPAAGPVDVVVRPEQIELTDDGPATVELVEFYGHDSMITVVLGDASIKVRTAADRPLAIGDSVGLAYKGESAVAFV